MSNQDNQGLSIFDDDEPETGSTGQDAAAASDTADAEKTQVLPAVKKDVAADKEPEPELPIDEDDSEESDDEPEAEPVAEPVGRRRSRLRSRPVRCRSRSRWRSPPGPAR